MNRPLFYLPEAEDDIAATFRSYQLERHGLGDQFKSSLRRTLDAVEERPLSYAVYWKDVRTALLHRFPYVV